MSLATDMVSWSLVAVDIHSLCGNHFILSYICVDDVDGVHKLW